MSDLDVQLQLESLYLMLSLLTGCSNGKVPLTEMLVVKTALEVSMMVKTLHRPFLDPLHHQNTRSSLLGSWSSV